LDADEELLAAARARHPRLRFERADVTRIDPEAFAPVDGIWASFVAAYLGDLSPVLERWSRCLVPGGWLALVEMDDLLGHAPLPAEDVQRIQAFYEEARRAGRYDFHSGRRLAGAVRAADLHVLEETTLEDDELSFSGPAPDGVLEAWRLRLARMGKLREFFGARFAIFEQAFLEGLTEPEHRSTCRVIMVVATRER
jgi:SAM-dependent methyltransferase